MNTRCHFLEKSFVAALSLCFSKLEASTPNRKPIVILRSSWQTVNIGDIAHTPGVLHLLEKHCPNIEVRLWPSDTRNGVKEMLQNRFPKLNIIQKEHLDTAMQEADFLLHGSGPSLVAKNDVQKWIDKTGKPFGVFGITFADTDEKTSQLLSKAKFIFFRDSISLEFAKKNNITAPIMEFGPDGAFAVDLRNDALAESFLIKNNLTKGKFLCCIPRLRFTPYWKIKNKPFDKERHLRNETMKEHDHAPLREAIIAVIKETDMKVLVCPEDQSQMDIGKEMIYDKLPAEIKQRVVWREQYWLTDEALSVYTQSAGLFGLEMHSPIMCIGNDIPAVVCRFHEQTSKGIMWKDIGLDDWLFDMDQPEQVKRLSATILDIAKHPESAKQKARAARLRVELHQKNMTQCLMTNL